MIFVYSKPDCVACDHTKRFLTAAAVPFKEIDASPGTDEAEGLKAKGYTALPVVSTDRETWTGYRREKLKDLAAAYHGAHHA